MARNLLKALAALVLLSSSAFADSTIHGYSTNTTSPIPSGSCLEVDQGPGTDTKLCSGYAVALGALAVANNLSDVSNLSTSINNLLNSIGSTRGTILFRGAATWSALAPGTSGQFLQTLGAGADPIWQNGSGSTSPGGSNTQAQFNNSGSFGGSSGLALSTTKVVSMSIGIGGDATGDIYYNSGGGGFTRLGIGSAAQVLTVSGGLPSWQNSAGGGTPNQSVGTFGGAVNAYTMPSPSPAVSSNVAYYRACGSFPAAVAVNTAASTLAVGSAAALPIRKNTTAGLVALTNGDITGQIQNQCFQLDSTAGFWIMQDPPLAITQTNFNGSATTVDWTNGTNYKVTTAGNTITLPSAAGLSPNGYLMITTIGVPVTLAATGSDVINTGLDTASAAGGSIPIPPNSSAFVQTSGSAGATAFTVTLSQAGAQTFMLANAGSTGTTINHLAKLTGATAVLTATTDVGIPSWVVIAGAGTTGKALLATGGVVQCVFDASGVTAGHYVVNSTATAGDCADGGAAVTEASNLAVGIALQTVGSGLANILALPWSGPTTSKDISWAPGMNLAAADVSLFRVGGSGSTIVSIVCRPDVVVGGTATIDLYMAPSGTALLSGTKLNTTPCNANTGATTEQVLGNAVTTLAANNWVGFHATGPGWSSSLGAGGIQISYVK